MLLRNTSDIDWNELQNQAENLYKSWTTITLDLNTMNVTSDDILAYNTNIDNLMVSLKEKNKVNSAICLANMYSLIPNILMKFRVIQQNLNWKTLSPTSYLHIQ